MKRDCGHDRMASAMLWDANTGCKHRCSSLLMLQKKDVCMQKTYFSPRFLLESPFVPPNVHKAHLIHLKGNLNEGY